MKVIQFSVGSDPAVTGVLSPFSGQPTRVHRFAVDHSIRQVAPFPVVGTQLMKVPELGYWFETVAFVIFGVASLALVLMPLLMVD
jgi:hypothetical protein